MKNKSLFLFLVSLVFFTSIVPYLAFSTSKNTFLHFVITNQSGLPKFNSLVEIVLPPEWKNQPCVVLSDSNDTVKLPFIRKSNESGDRLLVQISLASLEEKKIIIKKGDTSKIQDQIVSPSAPGTDFLFVNYKEAILISTEADNRIRFFSNDGKQFSPESVPLVLGEGKSYTLRTGSPQLVNIKSEKPLYVYASSINYQKDNTKIEAGDSDTTTLYTNFGFIYVHKHIWISSYEETEINLFDENGRNVFSKKLSANSGHYLDHLPPGPYKIISTHPVTIQFGYLDDENFSFIHGPLNQIHGYAFGDLLVQSLQPNTTIEISWEKKGKQKHQFKDVFEFETFKPIDEFLPKQPEYTYFSLESNYPVRVCSFSSGNNFGGEFITGNTLSFNDRQFRIITTRVSKEFSKEQTNLIELIGLTNDTDVVISGAVNKKITLQKNTHFDVPSSTPLEKIAIESSSDMMVCQLHNYTNKGLFYNIPALSDNTIVISSNGSFGEGIVQDIPDQGQGIISWFKIKEFFRNVVHIPYLPLTFFFVGLIGIFTAILLIVLNKMESHIREKREKKIEPMKPIEEQKEKVQPEVPAIEESEASKPITNEEKPVFKYQIPDLNTINKNIVYPTLHKVDEIPEFHRTTPDIKKPEKEDVGVVSEKKPTDEITEIQPVVQSPSDKHTIQSNVVLDPGSANRLFYESQLQCFSNAYMVSSSAKKLPQGVHEYLRKIDLNLQDQTRISNLMRSLPIMEESAKAIALCKKLKIAYYISSYPLPQKILGISIIPVSEWKHNSIQ